MCQLNQTVRTTQALAERLAEVQRETVQHFMELTDELKRNTLNKADLCDLAYLTKQAEELFDELRKDAKARKELAMKLAALRVIEEAMSDPANVDLTVRGALATGTVNVRNEARLPKPHSDEWNALMDYFNVPNNLRANGAVKVSYQGVADLCTELAEAGKQLPPGVRTTYPVYRLSPLRSCKRTARQE